MERKKLIKKVDECFEYDFHNGNEDRIVAIDDLIYLLGRFKNINATHVKIDGITEYDDRHSLEELSLTPIKVSFETEEEYNKRLEEEKKKEEERLKSIEQRERETYLILKKKFEN